MINYSGMGWEVEEIVCGCLQKDQKEGLLQMIISTCAKKLTMERLIDIFCYK